MTNSADILRVFADPKKVKLLGQLCDDALPLHTPARATGGLQEQDKKCQNELL